MIAKLCQCFGVTNNKEPHSDSQMIWLPMPVGDENTFLNYQFKKVIFTIFCGAIYLVCLVQKDFLFTHSY